ncbi:MICOS complex subunit MIC26-like [Babylonia areolata]|uniref:MICOS complex subunit MIC26-like n=1 Tax=Babylonia areolata TaxID=304850 RepID=UPI003FD4745F
MAARRATHLLRLGVGSAALASIPAMTYTVYAAGDQPPEERRVKVTELSLYENPEDRIEYRILPEDISPLRQGISEVRQAIWNYLEAVQETTDMVKEKFDIGKAHTEGLIDYIQNDPGMLPRAAVITVAGLGGIIAGYRGGVMRKLFFSTTAVVAATSLCYPNEAVALTTGAYNSTVGSISSLWSSEDSDAECQCSEAVEVSTPTTTGSKMTSETGGLTIEGDLGQSREEDEDMYTNRSRT